MASTQPILHCRYRYRYDPLDRLINQIQPDMPVQQRFYCKSRLATEIQGAIKYSIVQHDDLLLAQQQHQDDAIHTSLLATDLQRSVLYTRGANQQRQSIAYSPYGHRPASSGLLSLLGFNGERPDSVTGHYLLGNGYRAFNPVLMRFNSPDSWSPFGKGGLNSYSYVAGDSMNYVDPTGHAPIPALSKLLLGLSDNLSETLTRFFSSATDVPPTPGLAQGVRRVNYQPDSRPMSQIFVERQTNAVNSQPTPQRTWQELLSREHSTASPAMARGISDTRHEYSYLIDLILTRRHPALALSRSTQTNMGWFQPRLALPRGLERPYRTQWVTESTAAHSRSVAEAQNRYHEMRAAIDEGNRIRS